MALDLLSLPGSLSQDTLLVIGAYGALAGLYLLVVPLALFLWMNKRWHQMGKIERLVVYGMVFLFSSDTGAARRELLWLRLPLCAKARSFSDEIVVRVNE